MAELNRRGLTDAISEYAASGRPFLGICLGMQMMLDTSEEFGESDGLGLLPGRVVPVPRYGTEHHPHKIPHIGWNEIRRTDEGGSWSNTILSGIADEAPVYFVHSFMAIPNDSGARLADCDYDGVSVPAVIQAGNIYGCQFHPEKSGSTGLAILKAFLTVGSRVA